MEKEHILLILDLYPPLRLRKFKFIRMLQHYYVFHVTCVDYSLPCFAQVVITLLLGSPVVAGYHWYLVPGVSQ